MLPAYFAGFTIYWVVWCVLFPVSMLGRDEIHNLFNSHPVRSRAGILMYLLVLPLLPGYAYMFPQAVRGASAEAVIASAFLAIVNRPLEELLCCPYFPVVVGAAAPHSWHSQPASVFSGGG